ncbi:unnamed protein product [Leuciscus chuanchicus]
MTYIIQASEQKQQRADRHQDGDRREKRFACRSQEERLGSTLKGWRHNSSDLCVPSLQILRELINKSDGEETGGPGEAVPAVLADHIGPAPFGTLGNFPICPSTPDTFELIRALCWPSPMAPWFLMDDFHFKSLTDGSDPGLAPHQRQNHTAHEPTDSWSTVSSGRKTVAINNPRHMIRTVYGRERGRESDGGPEERCHVG